MVKNPNFDKLIIREAVLADAGDIATLDEEVWKESPATCDKIKSRIEVFQEGNIVAELNGYIVGYLCLQFVDDITDSATTWSAITDNGFLKKSHKPNGEYMFGVNLTVSPKVAALGVGTRLMLAAGKIMILNNRKGCLIGSRIPGYHKRKDVPIEKYISMRNGRYLDPELRYYQQGGFKVVRPLPGYFPDKESLDYGVLIYKENPFYGNPFRRIIAYLLDRFGFRFAKLLGGL